MAAGRNLARAGVVGTLTGWLTILIDGCVFGVVVVVVGGVCVRREMIDCRELIAW